MNALLMPVSGHTGISSWEQHQRRNPRSSEPGTDLFVPHGTPVYAPADGRIYGAGWDINQPAGRWVGIDFDNGFGFRCMHHADLVRTTGRVEAGDLIAYSGASGYGSEFFGEPSRNAAFWRNTGGDHTHVTLWPTHVKRFGYGRDGRPFTIDFMNYVGRGTTASTGSRPFEEEDDMYDAAAEKRLMDALDDVKRIAAPIKLYTYGSGIVAVNPLTGGWMILAPGYSELLNHLGLAVGSSRRVDEGQFGYVTQYVANTVGIPSLQNAEGFSDEDLAAIKDAIEKNRIALSQEQLDQLTAAVAAGARDGGEAGARAAVEGLTFVVSSI